MSSKIKYPNVKFALSKRLDVWAASEFGIKADRNYIDKFYSRNKKELEKFTKESKKRWDVFAPHFFGAVAKLFKNYPWPRGKYIGYASIFNCNPRFLRTKTFQVYFRHEAGPLYVAAHELLHFMFYGYALNKHPKLFRGLDPESGLLWDVSEIFNAVILHSPEFKKLHGIKKQVIYAEHKPYIKDLKKLWAGSHDVNNFILSILSLLLKRGSRRGS